MRLAAAALLITACRAEPSRNSDGTPHRLLMNGPSRPPYTLVLAYEDFGPQVSAHELLGAEWWAWEAGGNFAPSDRFEIPVVVFHGAPRPFVEALYPTIPLVADHRIVERDRALAYLDSEIAEISEPELAELRDRLVRTRTAITRALGR